VILLIVRLCPLRQIGEDEAATLASGSDGVFGGKSASKEAMLLASLVGVDARAGRCNLAH
jgi:hypothetical protein